MTTLARAGYDARQGHALARRRAAAGALDWLAGAAAAGNLVLGPGGHAVVTAALAQSARQVRLAGGPADRAAGRETILRTVPLPGATLIALRHVPAPGGPSLPAPWSAWIGGLAWIRLGLSEALLDDCVSFLRGRMIGEAPLLLQQLVRGAVAETLGTHLEIRAVLDGSAPADLPAAALGRVHEQITASDRELGRLLGAACFLSDGPGQRSYASALLSDAYLGECLG